MYKQIEDEFGDIIGKARRGQEIERGALAQRVSLSARDLEKIENYELIPDQSVVCGLAEELNLQADKLQLSAGGHYFPCKYVVLQAPKSKSKMILPFLFAK